MKIHKLWLRVYEEDTGLTLYLMKWKAMFFTEVDRNMLCNIIYFLERNIKSTQLSIKGFTINKTKISHPNIIA